MQFQIGDMVQEAERYYPKDGYRIGRTGIVVGINVTITNFSPLTYTERSYQIRFDTLKYDSTRHDYELEFVGRLRKPALDKR